MASPQDKILALDSMENELVPFFSGATELLKGNLDAMFLEWTRKLCSIENLTKYFSMLNSKE